MKPSPRLRELMQSPDGRDLALYLRKRYMERLAATGTLIDDVQLRRAQGAATELADLVKELTGAGPVVEE